LTYFHFHFSLTIISLFIVEILEPIPEGVDGSAQLRTQPAG